MQWEMLHLDQIRFLHTPLFHNIFSAKIIFLVSELNKLLTYVGVIFCSYVRIRTTRRYSLIVIHHNVRGRLS
jgi:hypothetical protein